MKFCNFDELNEFISNKEKTECIQLWIERSRTVVGARKKGVKRYVNDDLKYYELTYRCIHSGSWKSRSTGLRPNRKSFRQKCPFMLRLRVSEDGNSLDVMNFIDQHSHPCDKTRSDLKCAAKQKSAARRKSLEVTGGGSPNSKNEMEIETDVNNQINNVIVESVIYEIPNEDEFLIQETNNDENPIDDSDVQEDDTDQPEETAHPGTSRNVTKDKWLKISQRKATARNVTEDKWLKISQRKATAMEKLAAATEKKAVAAERKAAALEKIAVSMEVIAKSFETYIP